MIFHMWFSNWFCCFSFTFIDFSKREKKPVWQFVSEMPSEEILNTIDFRYISNVITPNEALKVLKNLENSKNERISKLKLEGYPSYTTSAGWLGYNNEKLKRLCHQLKKSGFQYAKFKVGKNINDDISREVLYIKLPELTSSAIQLLHNEIHDA